MKNIFYLILIDNGQIICSKKMDKIVLPYIEQDCIFKNVQEAKKFFNNKTKLFIKKNDFNLARIFSEEGLCFFAVVVDVNYRDNLKKINFGTITELKQVPLMLVKEIKWDDASAIAIENFTRNINYKDAFSIIEAESKFNYYSKESLKTINEFFNDITNIWQYDSPDVIVEMKNAVVGLECFQINAAGRDSNGSIGVVGHKEMLNKIKPTKIGDIKSTSKHFDNSIHKLFDDFKYSFNNHCSKIKTYSERLKVLSNKQKQVIGFYVNDTTLLGTYYRPKEGGFSPLYIFNIKEFWDLYLKAENPFFLIFIQTEAEHKNMFFITKSDYNFLIEKNEIWPISEIEQMFFDNPNLIGTGIPL